jgi:hypothetical protein
MLAIQVFGIICSISEIRWKVNSFGWRRQQSWFFIAIHFHVEHFSGQNSPTSKSRKGRSSETSTNFFRVISMRISFVDTLRYARIFVWNVLWLLAVCQTLCNVPIFPTESAIFKQSSHLTQQEATGNTPSDSRRQWWAAVLRSRCNKLDSASSGQWQTFELLHFQTLSNKNHLINKTHGK